MASVHASILCQEVTPEAGNCAETLAPWEQSEWQGVLSSLCSTSKGNSSQTPSTQMEHTNRMSLLGTPKGT